MAEHSKIEWTDSTWNPVRGCTKVSPGCKHCYAEAFAERFRGVKGHPYEQGFDLRLVPEKLTEPLLWAELVLEIEPQWLRHFYLFEKSKAGCGLLKFLKASQVATKDREIEIFCGDFNVKVDSILSSGRIGEKEATFCLLDQRTFECHWSTAKKLARYKTTKSNKFELFYFLAGWWYRRAVTAVKRDSVLENWWGRNDWPDLRQKKLPAVKDEMVARFKSELGYASAKAWPILDKAGRDMYFMIHATDYLGAPALMQRAYSEAVQPAERAVQQNLFPTEEKS